MYALYGETEFDVVGFFDKLGFKHSVDYAEHKLIDGKPRLQWIADNLDEINVTLVFHTMFCDPTAELNKLKQAMTAHEPAALVFGNGEYNGRFVITEISPEIIHTDPTGNPISSQCQVSFKEFVGDKTAKKGEAVVGADGNLPAGARINFTTPQLALPTGVLNSATSLQQAISQTASVIRQGAGYLAIANQAIQTARAIRNNPMAALGQVSSLMRHVGAAIPALSQASTGMGMLQGVIGNGSAISGAVNSAMGLVNLAQSGLSMANAGTAVTQISNAANQISSALGSLNSVSGGVTRMAATAITRGARYG